MPPLKAVPRCVEYLFVSLLRRKSFCGPISVKTERMAEQTKQLTEDRSRLDWLVRHCREIIRDACASSSMEDVRHLVRGLFRALAVLIAEAKMPLESRYYHSIVDAADLIRIAGAGGHADIADKFDDSCAAAARATGVDLLDPSSDPTDPNIIHSIARALLIPGEAPLHRIFFQTMPLHWIGCLYESLVDCYAAPSKAKKPKYPATRRKRGLYFTPQPLVDYVVQKVMKLLSVDRQTYDIADLRILDPAMGCGAFLIHVVELLGKPANGDRQTIAQNCVYGVDIDPDAVDIARFAMWAAAGFPENTSDSLKSHLICGDALRGEIPVPELTSRDRCEEPRFDAVVGNPPYIASKNGIDASVRRTRVRGQVDTYLLFLSMVFHRQLVRQDGVLSMVLPDPILVRTNAEEVRRILATEWCIESIVHILGAFRDAGVANAVVTARNAPTTQPNFTVSRIEKLSQRREFAKDPLRTAEDLARKVSRAVVTAQRRCEFLYLLEEEPFVDIIRRIHGPSLALSEYREPFVPLAKLNVRAIYRGEEIGKSAIVSREGDMPILRGGQSVRPYEILWEGFRVNSDQVRKPLNRYRRTKILIQKSAGRIVAALDEVCGRHPGYVFPQSVYAIELEPSGINHLYLLCLLNSKVMGEYLKRTATGYKLVQPQIEIEDIRALPIRRIAFTTPPRKRRNEVSRAISIFADECLRADEERHFPKLCDLVRSCLLSNPERSDVVHDLLAYLGRLAVDLSRKHRASPVPGSMERIECVRAAIDSVVQELYRCEPAQSAFAV